MSNFNCNVLNDFLKDEGYGFSVEEKEVVKNNGNLIGLSIKSYDFEDPGIIPVFYPQEDFYEYSLEEQAKKLGEILESSISEMKDYNIDLEELIERDNILNTVFPIVYGAENIKNFENNKIVYSNFLDMVIVYAIPAFTAQDGGMGTIKVNEQMLERSEITKEELHEAALNNNKDYKKDYRIDNMLGMLIGRYQNRSVFGASVIAIPEFLEFAHGFYGNFYVLPSSIHEVILIPEQDVSHRTKEQNIFEFGEMVKTVNSTVVDEKDILTNSVYYYDGTELSCVYYNEDEICYNEEEEY